MAGFDDAGVDRADGHFVYAVTFDTQEGVVLVFCLESGIRRIVAQRIVVGRPVGVAQPGALVAACRLRAEGFSAAGVPDPTRYAG